MTRVGPIGGGILAAAIYGILQVKNERVRCLLLKLSPCIIYFKCSSSQLLVILALPHETLPCYVNLSLTYAKYLGGMTSYLVEVYSRACSLCAGREAAI